MSAAEEIPLTETGSYRTRPLIEIAGERDFLVQDQLIGMSMEETEGGLSSAELTFRNTAHFEGAGTDYAFCHSEDKLFQLGNELTVFSGDEVDPQQIFKGKISALEFEQMEGDNPKLVVLAEDILQSARFQRRTKLHDAGPVKDLITAVADALQLSPKLTPGSLTEEIDAQMQINETDLSFLRRVLARFDADLQVVNDTLQVSPRSGVDRGLVTLELNSQLISLKICADLAHQVSGTTFLGRDVTSGDDISVANNNDVYLGPGQGREGQEVLADKYSERQEHCGEIFCSTEVEAQAVVNASYSRRARQFVVLNATAMGNPTLRVGTIARISGISLAFQNDYYITSACHRFSEESGYETDFTAECAYFGG